jgi:pimeloyl-ACP methyl ester carboxylesterase
VAKTSKLAASPTTVRTRRAYFDCKFGQLHVRTAFPATGGFDEQVTLFCLHPLDASSRLFSRFLPELADLRSVYAPDLPGCGESDPSPTRSIASDAMAISDMADDLRLRKIDLLGVHYGAEVAMAIAAARAQLVRCLVLLGPPAGGRISAVPHRHLVIDVSEYGDDPFGSASQRLAEQINLFLATAPSTA